MKHLTFILVFIVFHAITNGQKPDIASKDLIVADGRLPNMVTDEENNIHIVYGTGDSIMYLSSTNQGISFSKPVLVAVLPKLFAHAMRGPQIAATFNGLIITANTDYGNIYSFTREGSGKWSAANSVTDMDSVSKEALMGLSASGSNAFALWLDVRNNGGKGQRLFGAQSTDGGKTWSRNKEVYASPDKTICECCKPSVVVKGDHVYAMFRNWLNGNRDLYLISSSNGGRTFGTAKKLGVGNWKLNGCPMDGGGLAISENGAVETVWRREGIIFTSTGDNEKEIGKGRSPSMTSGNGKNIYTWAQDGDIVVLKPNGKLITLGKGTVPLVKSLNDKEVVCVWENEKQIHASIVEL
jgi:hypothetical protein